MELSQIKGANLLVTGDFFPRPPQVGRESETANKTTIAIFKVVSVAEGGVLYFIHPTTKEMIVCSPIDAGSVSYELNERDATNPFRVLVAYDYTTNQIVVTQGTPAADPVTPELGANQLFIAAFTEQAIGTQQEEPPAPVSVNYFRWKTLTKAAGSYSDIVDFSYSKVYLTPTGNITINNPATNLAGDFLPDGKTLMLCLRGSANTITWGNNFVQTDNSLPLSILTTKWNKIIITKNEVSGKYEWCNTDTVTA